MTVQTKTVEWKEIPNSPPYAASGDGRIKNAITGKILKPVMLGPKRKQYPGVYIGGGRKAKRYAVHRLVLLAFNGEPPDGHIGCHRDDDTLNNNIENLYWGSHKQNAGDQIRSGKFHFAIGQKNGMTKFPDKIITSIRAEYTGKRGEQSALAKKYGMTVGNVNLIVHRKTRIA